MMLQQWLGDDQTIDLKKWAMCLGLRKAYLDTLPNRRWAAHLIVLDGQRQPQELLRITLDQGRVRLRFLPPEKLSFTATPTGDLVTLATQIARASPPDPPPLFTLVIDHRALNEMMIALLADPERAKIFGARLINDYGRHWALHALTPIGYELILRVLQSSIWTQLGRWHGKAATQTVIFHRDSTPDTRRGVRQTDGQIELLEPAELINIPDAIWIDERLIGEGLDLLDRLLREPPQNVFALYAQIFFLLRHNYIRRPGGQAVSWLQMLPNLLKEVRARPQSLSVPPVPPPAKLTWALYLQLGTICETERDVETFEQCCSGLLDLLEQHPRARVTVGLTETALHMMTDHCAELGRRYRAGVEQGRFETVAVMETPPLPMLTSRQWLGAQAERWEAVVARKAQVWANGVVYLGENPSPGWGESLRGYGYQYVAWGEETLRRAYPAFDPTRPIIIEGWPAVGLHRESSRVLAHVDDPAVLDDYLRYLAASFADRPLAVRMNLNRLSDLDRLAAWLSIIERERYEPILLSELAGAQAQGSLDIAPDLDGLEVWTGSETARCLNSAFSAAWTLWQDLDTLAERVHADEQERKFDLDIQKIALDIQRCRQTYCLAVANGQINSHAGQSSERVEHALDQGRVHVHNRMLRLGSAPTLPDHALGTLRILEPLGVDRQNDLLTVSLPLPDSISPHQVVFMDQGMIVPAQWLGGDSQGVARFLLVVDLAASETKDLTVLTGRITSPWEGLDIAPSRLCNPTLAVLLDGQGQVTSIRFQGQERLCGPGNQVRGHLLELDQALRCDLDDADIRVTSAGPLRGTVTIRQTLIGGIVLTRHLHLSLFSSLLECETELEFPVPLTFAGKFIVGEFDLIGEQVIWPQPLQAGSASCQVQDAPSVIFSAQDTVELRKMWQGMRYIVHHTTSRTFQFAARPVANGLRVGLIASMPMRVLNPKRLDTQSGLGFPGQTYYGRYSYRYALQPVSPDLEAQATFYNRPVLWSFYPKQDGEDI